MAGKQLSREVRNGQTKQRNANRKAANLLEHSSRVKLSPVAQLVELDNRLGKGIGAKKERKKLNKEITA